MAKFSIKPQSNWRLAILNEYPVSTLKGEVYMVKAGPRYFTTYLDVLNWKRRMEKLGHAELGDIEHKVEGVWVKHEKKTRVRKAVEETVAA